MGSSFAVRELAFWVQKAKTATVRSNPGRYLSVNAKTVRPPAHLHTTSSHELAARILILLVGELGQVADCSFDS
jgi:hypothetical protein